jgi:methionyl-tRNA synthetase
MFVHNNFSGKVPEVKLTDDDKTFLALITRELGDYLQLLEKAKLRDGIRKILNISRFGNQHIQANKPWLLVKGSDADRALAGSLMGLCANVACLLSVMIQPYMPSVSATIQSQLNAPDDCNVLTNEFVCFLPAGHQMGVPSPLFQKIENSTIEELQKKFAGKQDEKVVKKASSPKKENVSNNKLQPQADGVQVDSDALEKAVQAQGDLVRTLKANKSSKSEIDTAVAALLDLKSRLALALGQDPAPATGKSKKKGKK